MSANDFGALALRIMHARSGGMCEGCGRAGVGLQAHHRLYRSRGGMGGAGNGLLLCGSGNMSGCHGEAHSFVGASRGWSVSSGEEPEQVPLVLARFGFRGWDRVLLTDSGLVLAADEIACWMHFGAAVSGCSSCRPAGRVLWEFEEEKGWTL